MGSWFTWDHSGTTAAWAGAAVNAALVLFVAVVTICDGRRARRERNKAYRFRVSYAMETLLAMFEMVRDAPMAQIDPIGLQTVVDLAFDAVRKVLDQDVDDAELVKDAHNVSTWAWILGHDIRLMSAEDGNRRPDDFVARHKDIEDQVKEKFARLAGGRPREIYYTRQS